MIGAFLRTSHRKEAETKARAVLERVGMIRLADSPARSLGTPGRKRLEIARARHGAEGAAARRGHGRAQRARGEASRSISSATSTAPASRSSSSNTSWK
ncbi:hypothetical protein ACU4GH_08880 [Bradyrhizobium betae]